jgi:probable HAF family extracellular repeat protein
LKREFKVKTKPNLRSRSLIMAALLVGTVFLAGQAWTQESTQEKPTWEVQLAPNAQANSTITIQNQCQQTHTFNIIQQQTPFLQLLAAPLVNVPGNSSYNLPVRFNTNGLNAGQYQGTVIVKCETCSKEKTCKQDREILPIRLTVVENAQAQPTPVSTATPSASPQSTANPIPDSTPNPTPSPGGHPPPTPTPTPHASPSPCASPPPPAKYSVKDLGVLPTIDGGTPHCTATGVNDAGNVVGACTGHYAGGSPSGDWRAFRSDAGGAVIKKEDELAFPVGFKGGTSFATAVNGTGHVVGFWTATGSGDNHAFWHDGGKKSKMINLHLSMAKFTFSRAFALNIHDDVVGAAYGPALGALTLGVTFFPAHAVIWSGADPKTMKDLNDDLDAGAKADWILTAAFGINDDGDIVGRAYNTKLKKYHAFLLKGVGGKFFDLGALKESATGSSAAYALNECGEKLPAIDKVVGYTYTTDDSYYGFIWTEATGLMDMKTLSGYSESYAKAINKKGEVVGASGDLHTSIVFDFLTCFGTCFTKGDSGDAHSHGSWYNGVELKDLNKLIPDFPGYEIEVANGINDKGQIAGSAFYKPPTFKSGGLYAKAVLLTPAGLTLPGPVPTTTSTACPLSIPSGGYIFDNWNVCGVKNGPTKDTTFTIDAPYVVTFIATYHWNYGKGALPTKGISLKDTSGKVYGPWPVTTSAGSGGAANVNWECHPGITLPAGTYTVVDPDPATWSQNDGSGNIGFARVAGSTTKK